MAVYKSEKELTDVLNAGLNTKIGTMTLVEDKSATDNNYYQARLAIFYDDAYKQYYSFEYTMSNNADKHYKFLNHAIKNLSKVECKQVDKVVYANINNPKDTIVIYR